MCVDPITAITLGTSGVGLLGQLFGGGNKPVEHKPINPQMDKNQQQLMAYLMSQIGQQRPMAPINPMALNAMNLMSSQYLGKGYQHPGLQMVQPPGGPMIPQSFGQGMNPGMGPGTGMGQPRNPGQGGRRGLRQ